MDEEEDRKLQAAARRKYWLRAKQDGLDYTTRIHNPRNEYRRKPKHRPKHADQWDDDF